VGDEPEGLVDCQVLVIEDDVAIQQLLIEHFLNLLGIHNILFAGDGIEGLAIAQRTLPDLIILDIEMPRMNGLEMLRQLRADPVLGKTPVIIQTAEQSDQRREQMFELGATDFVLKPLNAKEFLGRVRVHLENLLHLRRLQSDLDRIDQELQDAAELQRGLLPTAQDLSQLSTRYGLSISAVFQPSSQLGGDFWGVLPIDDQSVGIFLCDFAGHGVGAAMSTFQLHTMLERLPHPNTRDPAAFVTLVNQGLCQLVRQRHYATFLFAVIDTTEHRLRYASAGAPNPLVGRRGEATPQLLDGSGLPLGLSRSALYVNHELEFPPGSFLFLYSDALTETSLLSAIPLGEEGVVGLVAASAVQSVRSEGPLEVLLDSVMHRADAVLADDLTAVWIERAA